MSAQNLTASVHGRLLNQARATNRPFQELLQYFAMERFLYRLASTPHRMRFVLKGAMMLHVWNAPRARDTKDLDFLGRLDNSLETLERVVLDACTVDVEPDGMVFEAATVKAERIKEDADYPGVRLRFVGMLGKARVAMQIDVGFGDVVSRSPSKSPTRRCSTSPRPCSPAIRARPWWLRSSKRWSTSAR